jgi:hypothetical protein
MQTIPREVLDQVKETWEEEIQFGTTIKVVYWPTIQIQRSLFSPQPVITGRALEAVVVQPDGIADPYLAGETPLGDAGLTAEEIMAIPGAEAFITAVTDLLNTKLIVVPPVPPEPPPESPVT